MKEMERCLFVNCDNVDQFRSIYAPKVAVIARPDTYLAEHDCTQVIVETDYGVFTRAYLSRVQEMHFIIVYGRHARKKTTSLDIDFNLTQMALSILGITCIVGNFVVGSVSELVSAGNLLILEDFIGLSGYNSQYRPENQYNFRNKDLYEPFDQRLRSILVDTAKKASHAYVDGGVYGCLVGYPRLETKAEYCFYRMIGCDVIGKTLDPEATLAHQASCKYAALAVTIDDNATRQELLRNPQSKIVEVLMREGRQKMFALFLGSLHDLHEYANQFTNPYTYEQHEKSTFFYYRPQRREDHEPNI